MYSTNPATEQVIREYADHDPSAVVRVLEQAKHGLETWRGKGMDERGRCFGNLARLMRERRRELASLMTSEMGKPIVGAEAEIDKCAMACEFFAKHAAGMLADEMIGSDASRSYVRYEPLGVILAIMPWNFPFWQVIRFAAPALMAGNVAVLKHAWNVPGCALAIEKLFSEAGFGSGVMSALLISNEATEALIADPAIAAVTLTGSERAGRAVAAAAGKVIKKCVLELGGSDPFIVLPDVDIEKVAESAASARCINSGQSCIAAKRFIVLESIAARFEKAFAARMTAMKVGDPMDRATEVGPLARLDLLENLDRQVKESVAAGARLLTGGQRLAQRGIYYAPTVLADVRPGMAAFDEETFGPVAAVMWARDVDHAIELANASRYGLAASIWTNDIPLAERLAGRLDVGCVFINGIVKSDPRLPFGGIKNSGFGRELSTAGIREFVNIKTVWVR